MLLAEVSFAGQRLDHLDLAPAEAGDGGGLGLDEGEQGEGVGAEGGLVTSPGVTRGKLAGSGPSHGHEDIII